jgi:hypothetical protein
VEGFNNCVEHSRNNFVDGEVCILLVLVIMTVVFK